MAHRRIMVKVLTSQLDVPLKLAEAYMKSNMKELSFLILRSVDISKALDAIRRVNIDISPERLAKRLDLFGATPNTISPALSDPRVETVFRVHSRGWGRTSGRRRGGILRGRRRSPLGAPTQFAAG